MAQIPLAIRMRPEKLSEIVGQQHILGKGTLLSKMIENDNMQSIILYGPPGTGKTTIASVIAKATSSVFKQINAVAAGKKDIEVCCAEGEKNKQNGISTILFIDEIHRFNKAQQDYLLPYVENGSVILIGATTENPYFEVNGALISRSQIFELKPVSNEDIKTVVLRALCDTTKGLGAMNLSIDMNALDLIAEQSSGDVRHALTLLDTAALMATPPSITVADVETGIHKPHLRFDKDGDMHYDTISAFIKSMRGSDPDAVLYYLARMLEAGEDPKFIARRIMIHAAEDVGEADPMALVVATSASLAVERIGLPEGRIILAEAALYIANAPKSNTVIQGIDEAINYVHTHPSNDIPPHLQDAHYKSASKLGHGVGYLYPHDFPNHWVKQQYLPDSVNEKFYHTNDMGYQKTINAMSAFIKN